MERKEEKHEENGTPDENEEKDNFYRNENNENPRVNEEKAKLDKNEEKENPDTKFSWNACSQW